MPGGRRGHGLPPGGPTGAVVFAHRRGPHGAFAPLAFDHTGGPTGAVALGGPARSHRRRCGPTVRACFAAAPDPCPGATSIFGTTGIAGRREEADRDGHEKRARVSLSLSVSDDGGGTGAAGLSKDPPNLEAATAACKGVCWLTSSVRSTGSLSASHTSGGIEPPPPLPLEPGGGRAATCLSRARGRGRGRHEGKRARGHARGHEGQEGTRGRGDGNG